MQNVKEKLDALKAEYLATTDRARRNEINDAIARLASENPEEAGQAFSDQLSESVSRLRTERIRDRLGDVADAINWSYIARTYFHKSRGWLYQRLNGNIHNGKVARFTAAEAAILDDALSDLAKRLSSVSIK